MVRHLPNLTGYARTVASCAGSLPHHPVHREMKSDLRCVTPAVAEAT